MKILMFVVLLEIGLHGGTAVTHSLMYFDTGSSGVSNFPEFVAVGLVDEVQITHCDSNTKKAEPKQDWMNRVSEDDPQYWERETGKCVDRQQLFKVNIEVAKQRFNQTGGVHIVQRMVGCEWDDETDEVIGFDQWGYDGEDYISFDVKTETWIAPKQQAVITKHTWDNQKALTAATKNFFTHRCPDWLKKYVEFGRSSLMRTERPSVSLLQKTSSSPVSCHASGFYPERSSLFWRKDGEELHEDVDHGEILPNHDGTFQMSVDLDLSSVTPGDWRRYECVFQLSGVKDGIVTKLDKDVIRTNEVNPVYIFVIVAVVVVLLLVLIAAVGFMVYRKKKADKLPPPSVTSSDTSDTLSDISIEIHEKLDPESLSTSSSEGFHSASSSYGSSEELNPESFRDGSSRELNPES